MSEPTQEQPQVTATVSPAPPPKSRWDAIPHHLGRARTSTVVLSVLFLGIGALWLNVRPDPPDPPTNVVPAVEQPLVPAPTTAAPTPGTTTAPAPTTTPQSPRTSSTPTTPAPDSTAPTEQGTPLPTTTAEAPAPAPESSPAPTPTG